jgi:hypothetical protein
MRALYCRCLREKKDVSVGHRGPGQRGLSFNKEKWLENSNKKNDDDKREGEKER